MHWALTRLHCSSHCPFCSCQPLHQHGQCSLFPLSSQVLIKCFFPLFFHTKQLFHLHLSHSTFIIHCFFKLYLNFFKMRAHRNISSCCHCVLRTTNYESQFTFSCESATVCKTYKRETKRLYKLHEIYRMHRPMHTMHTMHTFKVHITRNNNSNDRIVSKAFPILWKQRIFRVAAYVHQWIW